MTDSILKYDSEIIWSLPCFFQYQPVIGALSQTIRRIEPETKFKTQSYGAPVTVWSGEMMPDNYERLDDYTIDTFFEYYEEVDSTPVFTFTSTNITPDDLGDEYANYILNKTMEYNCQYAVFSDDLKNHIKEKNPCAVVCASHIKAIDKFQAKNIPYEEETKFYNDLLKEYDYVYLRPEYVKNALLKDITLIDDLSRSVITINSSCMANCKSCMSHLKVLENFSKKPSRGESVNCPLPFAYLRDLYDQNLTLTSDEIRLLFDKGVRVFKYDKEKEPSVYMDILILKIASQLFNTDGANYMLMNRTLSELLGAEIGYFKEKFAQSEYARKAFQ